MEPISDVDRNLLMERSQSLASRSTRCRDWPLWRLLGVAGIFIAIAHIQFGVRLSDLRRVPLGVMTAIEVSLALSFFSGLAGGAFAGMFLVWPFAVVARANNRFFDLGETISARLIKPKRPRWALAYALELAFFLAIFYGGRFVFLRLGARL